MMNTRDTVDYRFVESNLFFYLIFYMCECDSKKKIDIPICKKITSNLHL